MLQRIQPWKQGFFPLADLAASDPGDGFPQVLQHVHPLASDAGVLDPGALHFQPRVLLTHARRSFPDCADQVRVPMEALVEAAHLPREACMPPTSEELSSDGAPGDGHNSVWQHVHPLARDSGTAGTIRGDVPSQVPFSSLQHVDCVGVPTVHPLARDSGTAGATRDDVPSQLPLSSLQLVDCVGMPTDMLQNSGVGFQVKALPAGPSDETHNTRPISHDLAIVAGGAQGGFPLVDLPQYNQWDPGEVMSPMGVVPVFIPPALPHAHGVPDPMAEVYTGGAQVPQPHQACYEAGPLVFFARLAAAACGAQVADLSPSDARACTD